MLQWEHCHCKLSRKENNDFLYVNAQSNHPPIVTQNIPLNIEKMVNDLCSNEDIFNKAKCDFQDALKESGYDYNIEFKEKNNQKKKISRSRQVLWFNPPYSCHVKTDLGRKFLKLIDKVFKKTHPLS